MSSCCPVVLASLHNHIECHERETLCFKQSTLFLRSMPNVPVFKNLDHMHEGDAVIEFSTKKLAHCVWEASPEFRKFVSDTLRANGLEELQWVSRWEESLGKAWLPLNNHLADHLCFQDYMLTKYCRQRLADNKDLKAWVACGTLFVLLDSNGSAVQTHQLHRALTDIAALVRSLGIANNLKPAKTRMDVYPGNEESIMCYIMSGECYGGDVDLAQYVAGLSDKKKKELVPLVAAASVKDDYPYTVNVLSYLPKSDMQLIRTNL